MDEGLSPDDYSDAALPRQPKRQKTGHHEDPLVLRHDQYTIAWICALHIEMAAARAMLDDIHDSLPQPVDDSNTYILGRIKQHNIVIACLPNGQYGTNNAAIAATNMMRSFKSIRACLMVGIGGGAPSKADVRLGDVVVGIRVMQCDLGKIVEDGQLQRTAVPRLAHPSLGTAVSTLRAKHELSPSRIPSILQQHLGDHLTYCRPNLPDRLFYATYDHVSADHDCNSCDQSKLVLRGERHSDDIKIHYGAIASGNQVMRNGKARDDVAQQLDVICFEMETSGLVDLLPCLPVRGICDYSDSHKSKEWQRYAAATAAACARELLEELSVTEPHALVAYTRNFEQCPSEDRRQSLLTSLRFEHIDSRKLNIKSALSKTCGWLLDHPYYRAWLDPTKLTEHHGFMWLSGKPGAGKSTIMKFAYTSMKRKARLKNAVTASFFFNARGDYLEKSVLGMYRSLLLQLLEGYPDLQIILDDSDMIPHKLEGCPSLNILKDIFYKAVSALGQREFTCFVDALDECDEQQVVDMVHSFEDLTERISAAGFPFRICFSSRHYPYIIIRQGLRLTLEEQSGHAGDLATYAASRLRIDDPILAEELRFQLLDKAAGVFMWVVLVVDILNKEYRRGGMSLKKRLAEIPSDLSALFKDILRRDNDDMQALLLCILWILYAKRPLKPTEFYHALWSGLLLDDLVDRQIPDATISDTSARLNRFERYVISSSKGLAEVTKATSRTVQFIHESVRDFLIKDNGLYELWPEVGLDFESPGHEKLKQCCSLYLNHPSVAISVSNLRSEPTSDERVQISTTLPFLEYASQNILYHANAAAKLVSQGEFLSSFALSRWIMTSNLFEKYKVRRYTLNASLVYVLADRGHPELIRTKLQEDPQIHVVGERYKYPLFAALVNGGKESVAALLNTPSSIYEGVEITEGLNLPKTFKGYENQTPLLWAAENGRYGIVKLLISQGEVNINEPDASGNTALSYAVANEHEAVAKLLLDKGAGFDTRNGFMAPLEVASMRGNEAIARLLIANGANVNLGGLWTPIARASEHGHEAVVRLLIENGADFNSGGLLTPILRASKHGHEAVVRLLIEKGADVNANFPSYVTPLVSALERGHLSIARLLLDEGAETNVCGLYGFGYTPLSWASYKGYDAFTSLLIERGAKIEFRDPTGQTPLLRAIERDNDTVASLLIEKGAEVNVLDPAGYTPLSRAIGRDNDTVASLLIEKGAEVNVRDPTGQTPLLRAIERDNDAVASLLIEKGAEVNVLSPYGWTPLLWAVSMGSDAVTSLLIDKGADVNVLGPDGWTPLLWAVYRGCDAVACLLIDKGANVNTACQLGKTPLRYALDRKHLAIARLLTERGADVSALTDSDRHILADSHVDNV